MSTDVTKKNSDIGKIFIALLVLSVGAIIAFIMTGCSVPVAETADPKASQAAAPAEVDEPVDTLEVDGLYGFGETVTWENNVSLSVSTPVEYQPSELAAGMVDGQTTVLFEMVLTNNSDENFDPIMLYYTASSGGVEASGVFDVSNGIDFQPSTVVLPGQSIKWQAAYSVADINNITLQTSIGFEYDDAIFTNG